MGAEHRIRYIDGLRAIAVMGVFSHHVLFFAPKYFPAMNNPALENFGRHGVELFFVLSGFCLAHPTLAALYARGSANFDIVKYAARRLVRILPPYYAAIVACSLILFVGRINPSYHVTAADISRQAVFLDNHTTLVNPSFWTLAIEFRWYFIMPLALAIWVKFPRVFLALLVAVPALSSTAIESLDLLLLPGFLLGIVAADVALRGASWARYAPFGMLAFGTIGVLTDPLDGVGAFTWAWILAAFCLVISAGQIRTLRDLCSMRWLTAIGIASYSIYLVHQPFIMLVRNLGVIALIALPLAGGFAFWWLAERPFVETALKGRCLRVIEAALTRYAERLGVLKTTITLHEQEQQPGELVA